MRYFRKVTMGKPVIMGRRTFKSLPRVLDGRLNIVLTRDRWLRRARRRHGAQPGGGARRGARLGANGPAPMRSW